MGVECLGYAYNSVIKTEESTYLDTSGNNN